MRNNKHSLETAHMHPNMKMVEGILDIPSSFHFHKKDTSSTRKMGSKKSLAFAKHTNVRHTISLPDYSPEEIQGTWYSSNEYEEISKKCVKQIHKMEKGEEFKNKKYCTRGLEQHTRLGYLEKYQHRREARDAVLIEQERQYGIKGSDPSVPIATAYFQVTSSSQMWANVVGLRDQREADEYLDDVELPQLVKKATLKVAGRRTFSARSA